MSGLASFVFSGHAIHLKHHVDSRCIHFRPHTRRIMRIACVHKTNINASAPTMNIRRSLLVMVEILDNQTITIKVPFSESVVSPSLRPSAKAQVCIAYMLWRTG